VAIAAASFLALYVGHVPFPVIILTAGSIGYLGALFDVASFGAKPVATDPATALDDAGETTAPNLARTTLTAVIWGVIWLAPIALLAGLFGAGSSLVTIGSFFAKLAVVTFGGAYAVLSYVTDVAVADFHWLKPGEMLDGLALAETTPGPLLLVLPFVGFQAAFRASDAMGGWAAGAIGATLVAWVTFVPSFLWIFVGAPYIERLRGMTALSSALTGITAAVVGVILNLAIWFALHTLFYDLTTLRLGVVSIVLPIWSTLDLKAVALAAIAAALLFRARFGVVPTLVVSGGLGWILKLLA
jgi:chromate transporter